MHLKTSTVSTVAGLLLAAAFPLPPVFAVEKSLDDYQRQAVRHNSVIRLPELETTTNAVNAAVEQIGRAHV